MESGRTDFTTPWLWLHEGKRRYYKAWVDVDLFGDRELARAWGSLDTRRGGGKRDAVGQDDMTLRREFRRLLATRRRHGYVLKQGGLTEIGEWKDNRDHRPLA